VGRNALIAVVLVAALGSGCGGSGGGHRRHRSSPTTLPAPTRAPAKGAQAKPTGGSTSETMLLGRSEDGRRIFARRVGDRSGPRVLVFGCIHGNETAGIIIARALERVYTADDVWIVPVLNPDGVARGTRQDARGVDLNANWSSQWQAGGRPWDVYDGGPRPFSERETRLARKLILRVRPRVTIWFHQHMDVVWAFGASTAAGRLYARLAGMRLYHHHWLSGTAANWQNHHMPSTAAITVELPAGNLSPQHVRRNVRAVLSVARLMPGPGSAPPGRSTG
jgi:protein MpaA